MTPSGNCNFRCRALPTLGSRCWKGGRLLTALEPGAGGTTGKWSHRRGNFPLRRRSRIFRPLESRRLPLAEGREVRGGGDGGAQGAMPGGWCSHSESVVTSTRRAEE